MAMVAIKEPTRGEVIIDDNKRSSIINYEIQNKLQELKNIQDGWMDGEGMAAPPGEIDWLIKNFSNHYCGQNLPTPNIFLTENGNVEVSWALGSNVVIFEFYLNTHKGSWLQFSMNDSGTKKSQILDLNDSEEWVRFTGEIIRLSN